MTLLFSVLTTLTLDVHIFLKWVQLKNKNLELDTLSFLSISYLAFGILTEINYSTEGTFVLFA